MLLYTTQTNVVLWGFGMPCCSKFFGYRSDSNNIKYIYINPYGGTNMSTLDNFTYEEVSSAVPESSTWAMMILGFLGLGSSTQGLNAPHRLI
jgi:hypothetical protein